MQPNWWVNANNFHVWRCGVTDLLWESDLLAGSHEDTVHQYDEHHRQTKERNGLLVKNNNNNNNITTTTAISAS